jgi:hypothetical protein
VSPWTIIGWVVLGIIALGVLVLALFIWDTYAKPWLAGRVLHYKTRRIAPVVGQVWMQGSTGLTITDITSTGRICLTTQYVIHGLRMGNGASWSDSPDEWQRRVMGQRLWLLKTDAMKEVA